MAAEAHMQVAQRLDGEEEEARRRIERVEIGMTARNLPPVEWFSPMPALACSSIR